MQVLGIDIGGSGIKGAIVDVVNGELVTEHLHLATPHLATPEAVLEVVNQLVQQFNWSGMIGCGFPAVIDNGYARTAANIDDGWIDFDVASALTATTGCRCAVINDADAAGLAEMRFGAGLGNTGTVLVLTLGTGIGSALFHGGQFFPNLELGALPYKGVPIERYASAAVRREQNLSWDKWAERLNRFFASVESILTPELIIVGGGVSSKHDKFFPLLETQAELIPAHFFNQAGIIGAACHASEYFKGQNSISLECPAGIQ